MHGHFWRHFLIMIFILFHMVACILFSMAAQITAYFKDSDWLLKILTQENGWKSYHGDQNPGYHVKGHEKLGQKQVSKVTLHFVWGYFSRKQTVIRLLTGSPGRPLSPGNPGKPGVPGIPVLPCGPGGPGGPSLPASPGLPPSPGTPGGPGGPLSPTAPTSPVSPGGPTMPGKPGGPCGPLSPGAPLSPGGPTIPSSPGIPVIQTLLTFLFKIECK